MLTTATLARKFEATPVRVSLWLFALMGVVSLVSVVSGSTPVTLSQVGHSLGLLLSGADDARYTMVDRIVVDLRLPRMLLAIWSGAVWRWWGHCFKPRPAMIWPTPICLDCRPVQQRARSP